MMHVLLLLRPIVNALQAASQLRPRVKNADADIFSEYAAIPFNNATGYRLTTVDSLLLYRFLFCLMTIRKCIESSKSVQALYKELHLAASNGRDNFVL